MSQIDLIRSQTLAFRSKIGEILNAIPVADRSRIPTGWNNHALWHAGHLLITPRLLGLALSGRPLGSPAGWRALFAKDSAPIRWPENPDIPTFEELVADLNPTIEEIIDTLGPNGITEPFSTPYTTSAGVVLTNPLEALQFSFCHDGIHLGLLLALRRDLARSA